jgi:hypothetical protein
LKELEHVPLRALVFVDRHCEKASNGV